MCDNNWCESHCVVREAEGIIIRDFLTSEREVKHGVFKDGRDTEKSTVESDLLKRGNKVKYTKSIDKKVRW